MSDILYVLRISNNGKDEYKIGVTNDLKKRVRNLQTGNSEKIEIAYYEEVDKNVNVNKLEKWIHATFDKNRKNGEWFVDLDIKTIRKMIYKYLIK